VQAKLDSYFHYKRDVACGMTCYQHTKQLWLCWSDRHKDLYSKTNQMHQCTKLFYFGMTLYMFRTVFPSIIRSSRLYIQQQAFVKQILFDKCLLLSVQSWTPDDGRKDHPKHVECHSKIKYFGTLVHLVGFTIEIYCNAWPCECQT